MLLAGAVVSNFLGKKLVSWGDKAVSRIPVVRSISSSVKQVSDTLFSSNGNAFRKAVLIEYPRAGVWTIGFLTGIPGGEVKTHLPDEYVSLYVPTTPNPTSGFFLIARRNEVTRLFDLTRDPGETDNLADREQGRLADLTRRLEAAFGTTVAANEGHPQVN